MIVSLGSFSLFLVFVFVTVFVWEFFRRVVYRVRSFRRFRVVITECCFKIVSVWVGLVVESVGFEFM